MHFVCCYNMLHIEVSVGCQNKRTYSIYACCIVHFNISLVSSVGTSVNSLYFTSEALLFHSCPFQFGALH